MKSINIYVEKDKDGSYWGTSAKVPGVVSAFEGSLAELKKNFAQAYLNCIELAKEIGEDWYQDFENPDFVYERDLQGFFKLVPEISMAGIAAKAHINTSLLRHYATGKATASGKRLKEIKEAVHELGQKAFSVSV